MWFVILQSALVAIQTALLVSAPSPVIVGCFVFSLLILIVSFVWWRDDQ